MRRLTLIGLILAALSLGAPTSPLTWVHAQERVLYEADWSQGLSGWTTTQGWRVANGMLMSEGARSGETVLRPPYQPAHDNIVDYALEVELQFVSWTGTCSSFGFQLRGGYTPGVHSCGTHVIIWGEGVGILRDVPYAPDRNWRTYRAEVQGSRIRLLVDGQVIAEATDSRFPSGGLVGIWGNARVLVRTFKIVSLSTNDTIGGCGPTDRGTITSGQTVTGTLDDCHTEDIWWFTAEKGSRVTIRMERPNPELFCGITLDPYVYLFAHPASGLVIEETNNDDNPADPPNAEITDYVLRYDGPYRIVATRYRNTYGCYSLTLLINSPPLPGPEELGLLDLDEFCRATYGPSFVSNYVTSNNIGWICQNTTRPPRHGDISWVGLNMDAACRWAYRTHPEGYRARAGQRDPNDPYSWYCYMP